jgi:uncharacterized protein YdeI (YjbR/CyaY-like superfamily)
MAAVVPDPKNIRAFKDSTAFETWLASNHDKKTELWCKLHKKNSGLPTVTYAEALDVALCWGWIDGLKKSFDDKSFLQRFTPRKPKSIWSQINRDHVARLISSNRMTSHGLKHVLAAKADGRWDAAYAPASRTNLPAEFLASVDSSPKAKATLATLNAANKFALSFRLQQARTPAALNKKIADLVAMLEKGETFHPNKTTKPKTGG